MVANYDSTHRHTWSITPDRPHSGQRASMDSALVISISAVYFTDRALIVSVSATCFTGLRHYPSLLDPSPPLVGLSHPLLNCRDSVSRVRGRPIRSTSQPIYTRALEIARFQCCGYAIQAYILVAFGCTIRLLDHSTSASSGHVKYFCWDPQLINAKARDDFDATAIKRYRQLMYNLRITSKKSAWMPPDYQANVRRPQEIGSRGERARALPSIRIDCSGLTSLTKSLKKASCSSRREGELINERSNEFWKEHEHRTTGAPMPTNHELLLELNDGLKKGHVYVFCVAESVFARSVPACYCGRLPIP
ncbi:hypothetical protein M9H77_02067 [Catharanthus roseus]|uniref:Uncharacterized protein n=1 Tax=Catharanthus roseus TaxID=4058 RepID=A0ACC0C7C1_CATRO|nr:hypothetical protein M9H77_02067 [Catharanthus roseus]